MSAMAATCSHPLLVTAHWLPSSPPPLSHQPEMPLPSHLPTPFFPVRFSSPPLFLFLLRSLPHAARHLFFAVRRLWSPFFLSLPFFLHRSPSLTSPCPRCPLHLTGPSTTCICATLLSSIGLRIPLGHPTSSLAHVATQLPASSPSLFPFPSVVHPCHRPSSSGRATSMTAFSPVHHSSIHLSSPPSDHASKFPGIDSSSLCPCCHC